MTCSEILEVIVELVKENKELISEINELQKKLKELKENPPKKELTEDEKRQRIENMIFLHNHNFFSTHHNIHE